MIGPGLTDKWYFAAMATTPLFPPKRIVRAFGAPLTDAGEMSTTMRIHHYRLRTPIGPDGHTNAGWEADFDFRIESPNGVRYVITFGEYFPGSAGRGTPNAELLTARQWLLRANVSVKCQ